jgi:hypothetical protein
MTGACAIRHSVSPRASYSYSMASGALNQWCTTRRARLDELYAAHTAVGGAGPGRRSATAQLNWSIALCLASEFQGYVRDLHDEASEVLIDRAYVATPAHESVLRNVLTLNRELNKGNATRSNLKQDFSRFGFGVLDEVKQYDRGEGWLKALDQLNLARNGIAHSDKAKVAQAAGGTALRLSHVKSWDGSTRSLTKALDKITADQLAVLTGGGRPW